MTTSNRARAHRQRRFFRTGELPLVLLAFVAQRPQHGYDLMAELDRAFGPAYRPSPGSIYPALSALETEGLVKASTDPDRRTYSLTPAGDQALRARAGLLAEIEARTGARLSGAQTVQSAIDRFVAKVRDVGGEIDIEALERLLDEAGERVEQLVPEGRR